MKICDLNTGAGRLLRANKELKQRWAETKQLWDDGNSRKFEEEFLQPLGPEIQLAIAAVQRLAELLEKAEKECEDRCES